MSEFKYTVYRVGVHARDLLDPERVELEKVGARQVLIDRPGTDDDFVAKTSDADGLIVVDSLVSRRVIEELDRLKVILRTGVGVDVIDVDAATEKGVAVISVPDLWIREVANHAMALLLACNRKLFLLDRLVRADNWMPVIPPPVGSLHGETLGMIGFGRIGRELARRGAVMDMKLVAYDPFLPESGFAEMNVESVSLEDLLKRSDYVSVHSPLTEETRHLVDASALKLMKATAYLINTSRGPVVDEVALATALQQGWIAGAGLDVLEEEPPDPDNLLLKLDNVILTPHSSYYSDAAIKELPVRCGQEVARVLSGRRPINLVNPDVLSILPLKDG